MTFIRFATCEKHRALGFLQKFYPSCEVTMDDANVAKVLEYVSQDVIRIPDPDFHPNGAVCGSKNWNDEIGKEAVAALKAMHDNLKPKQAA